MSVSMILAMAQNGVIGRDGTLPWHLPADSRRFKVLTTGHTIIMGRKTFESIGRPLPDRHNVVLSRDPSFDYPGADVVHDIAHALEVGRNSEEIFVIGGADIFRQTLAHANRIYLTLVHADVEGDRHVDRIDLSGWELEADEFHDSDDEHEHPFSFRIYVRKENRPAS